MALRPAAACAQKGASDRRGSGRLLGQTRAAVSWAPKRGLDTAASDQPEAELRDEEPARAPRLRLPARWTPGRVSPSLAASALEQPHDRAEFEVRRAFRSAQRYRVVSASIATVSATISVVSSSAAISTPEDSRKRNPVPNLSHRA